MEITSADITKRIKEAKQGKQSAFKFLLDYFWNEVYGFQLKRVRNEYDAEDITIETFARAFDRIEQFDEELKFSTWLIAISKNIQIDKFRKSKSSVFSKFLDVSKETIQHIPDHTPTAEDELIRKQNLAQLLLYIKKLKPDYQEVINLRYFQEMSYNEMADYLEQPLSTIKVRLLRARKLLAEIIIQKES